MRAYVFTDRTLAGQAGRFVWLEIDTEKAKNASFRKQFAVRALPTFLIVDPADERVALRWVGGASATRLKKILDDGRLAVAGRGPAPAGGGEEELRAEESLARADRLYGDGNNAEAAEAYLDALGAAPRGWPPYGRALESLLFALQSTDDKERCATLARESYGRVRGTPSAAAVATGGLDCAVGLPADNAHRAGLITALEADAREVLADTTLAIAGDDRSSVYMSLLEARKNAQDEAGAKQVAAEWSAFLDGAAARAKTPDQRTVYDPHRLTAYIELGQPERAIPMLKASERDFPGDYNPPARLAAAYKAMQRWDEALAASDRALAKAYGPRKLNLLQTRADIYAGRGDRQAARRTLEEAVRTAEALPPGQRSENTIASIKKKLEALQ
jgi:hypothetical protein